MANQSSVEQIEGTVVPAKSNNQANQVRRVIADVYTFVRSRELNKTISGFTLDHYIDEAKKRIKEPRIVRAASGRSVGTRPSHLEVLDKLEQEFEKSLAEAKRLAEAVKGDEQ